MVDQIIGVTIKGIGDFSDVVNNVGNVQKALTKLKLPDKLGENLNKNISNFMKEYDKYQKKIAEGIHTKGDQNTVNKSLNSMLNSYEKIIKDFGKLSEKDFKDIFNLDTGQFKKFQQELKTIEANIKKIKLDPKALVEPMNKIKELTSAKRLFGNGTGFDKLTEAFKANDFLKAKEAIQEIDGYLARFGSKMKPEKLQDFQNAWGPLKAKILDADAGAEDLYRDFDRVSQAIADLGEQGSRELQDMASGLKNTDEAAKSVVAELKQMHANEFDFNRQAADIDRQIQSYFGLSQMIRKVGDIAKDAFATVKELDKAMTQTAVVTNFSVGDMWEMLPTYTAQANQLGSTIKDVYEAATLYYQQGLNTNQAMGLANETLKMARIAGLDAAEATNMMTAALRGFNMEINQMSAQKVNDIYSELAAITASDTKEIGSAMERTASIANSANMDFATTSAFLAQMIETTREAPENLGTAMKTIVARFQEMKQDPTKLIDSEGVAMDANKVDKALKTIGVNLMNTKGEFRDLDDVFLDIASKWDSLSQGQQRYIATIAAGSRQQSRFIAMMSDYERTMELVDAANNSAGASQRQFEKTLDSMEAKLNMLKNAWDQFTMGLMNNQILKFGVDRLTDAFTIINKFIDILGSIPPNPFEGVTKSVLTLVTTLGMLNFGKKASRGLIMGGAGWWKGETSFTGGFSQGWKQSGQTGFFANRKNNVAAAQGKADAAAYNAAVQNEMAKGGFTKAIAMAWKTKGQNFDFTNTFGAAFGQFSGERFAASWSTDIEAEIIRVLNSVIDDAAKIGDKTGQEFKQHLLAQLKAGEISGEQLISSVRTNTGKDISNLGVNAKQLNEGAKAAENFGTKIGSAGDNLLRFGTVLQGTPLAPFGSMLSTVGMALSTFGSTINWVTDTFMLGMGKVVAAEGTAVGVTKLLGAGFKQLWLDMGPVGWVILGIIALAGVYKALDAAIVSNKEQLEAATDAAAAASEAYDSAKQETSELADAIDTIRETDSAFDGLVAGTAEFNEQLVTANEQIMALIDKYPMLNDSQYLSTDKNGLMHINEAGFKAVKEYQKQIQARASAMNLIQTADLNALENQQKAQQLRNSIKTNMSDDEQNRILRNADLLEQRAEAETKLAHLNAIRVGLVDKEIADQEKLASIYVDQYEAKKQVAEAEVEAMGKHDIRQAYADYHGYTYDKSTKKIKDVEGNEIDYDDAAIKDEVIEQTVMLDFEANASSLEGILHSLDRDFSKTLDKTFENSSTFISDVLSNNAEANEDLLEQVLDNPQQLNDFVEGLSTKELAAVLGVSEEAVESNVSSYKQQLEDKLLTNAQNIIDTNAQANGELAAMLAQVQGKSANEVLNNKNIQDSLIQQVKEFTSEQRNTLLNVGKTLEESVGSEAMATFIDGLSNIYKTGNEELIAATQNWVDSVNWESATSRLKGYNEAINMVADDTNHLGSESVKQINSLGKALLESKDEANLLGEAFEEFYNSTDFQDMAKNMDKFVDSSGQLNAASIMDMAEECHSLNNLLDTGAISAGGVAAALNALGSDGDLVLSDLNSRVLELLSNFGQLDDIIASSHRNIENFDWGIDTGEAEDFVEDSAKKWNELYNNGEVGNPQLEAYAKWVMGEDKYISLLASKHGDLEATMAEVSKSVNLYSEGFEKAWDKLAEGSWKNVDFSDDLKDLGISVSFDDNGDWNFEPGEATTEQLQKWLQQALKIGPEMAQAMIEDWSNYSPDFRAERQKNDFEAGLDSYVQQRRGADGGVAITASELDTIVSATGQEKEEVIAAIAEKANIDAEQVDILKNIDENTGEYITDGAVLNKELTEAVGAKGQNGWLTEYQAKDSSDILMKNTIDIENAMAGAIERGYTAAQAKSMAYESYTNAKQQGKDYYYKGELLEAGQYKTLDQFAARLEEIDQNEQWVTVGQAMADGFLNRLDALNKPEESSNENNNLDKSSSDIPKGTTIPGVGYVTADGKTPSRELTWEDRVPGWVSDLISALRENKPEENTQKQAQEEAKVSTQAFMDWFLGKNSQETTATVGLQDAALKLQEGSTQLGNIVPSLQTAADNLNVSAQNLTNAAAILSIPKDSTSSTQTTSDTPSNTPSNQQSSINGIVVVDNSPAKASLEELQAIAADVKTQVETPMNVSINIQDSGLTNVANKVKAINEGSGDKNISVTATASDPTDVNTLKEAVEAYSSLQDHTVKLTTSLSGASTKSIKDMMDVIDAFHKKTSHTVNLITNEKHNKEATGIHNHGYVASPSFGSAASGYGQLGPKGKGGLTLTGELGYEIAWIPSENRSMILGANGPQMINLPGDAIIWTHEQSEKILKQEAIPAGSHSKRHKGGNSNNSSSKKSSGKSKKSKKKSKKKDKKDKKEQEIPKIINYSIEETIRFNIDAGLEKLGYEIDKRTKSIEKTLNKIGATSKDVAGDVSAQLQALNDQKNANQALLDSYKRQSNEIFNWQETISYQDWTTKTETTGKGKKKKTTTTTELGSVDGVINLRDYMIQQADGSYIANEQAIRAAGNASRQKAIQDAVSNAVSSINKGMLDAQKVIDETEEKMAELEDQIYEAFKQWEKQITTIYILSQKLETATKIKDVYETRGDLELTRLQAGFTDLGDSLKTLVDASEKSINQLRQEIVLSQNLATEKVAEFNKAIQYSTYEEKFRGQTSNQAQQDYNGTIMALDLFYKTGGDIRTAQQLIPQAIKEYQSKEVNLPTEEFIKKQLDNFHQLQMDSFDAISENLTLVQNAFDKLIEYQETIKSFEDTLLEGLEEQTEKEIDKLSDLSDAISKALKDLLDDVKRKLDERRQQEDNLKTEQDISKKQQRLAALRANTAGGNQVEIARLEQEIADAQEQYQRSREDQLLNKLQEQADTAEQQRQQQIDLLETQNSLAAENNRILVETWLRDPEKYKEQIFEVWKMAQDYDSETKLGQQLLDNQFKSEFAEMAVAVKQTNFNEYFNSVGSQLNTLVSALYDFGNKIPTPQEIANLIKNPSSVTNKTVAEAQNFKKQGWKVKDLKAAGWDAKTLSQVYGISELRGGGFTVKDLNNAGIKDITKLKGGGYEAKDFKAANYSLATLKPYFTAAQLKSGGFTNLADYKAAKFTYAQLREGNLFSDEELSKAGYEEATRAIELRKQQELKQKQDKYNSLLNNFMYMSSWYDPSSIKQLLDAGKALNKTPSQIGEDLGMKGIKEGIYHELLFSRTGTGHLFDRFKWGGAKGTGVSDSDIRAIAEGIRRGYNKRLDSLDPWKRNRLRNSGLYYYKTGGLNTTTGPAWLDGTPSKPELVLDSTDTKNFLALRDVLSKVMGSTKSINNSYGGDNIFEININVDKIEKDYDVDRVADRVKKKILESSSYRNVTQVRNFR